MNEAKTSIEKNVADLIFFQILPRVKILVAKALHVASGFDNAVVDASLVHRLFDVEVIVLLRLKSFIF